MRKPCCQDVARHTNQSLASLSGERGLLLDESGHEKAGKTVLESRGNTIGNVGKVCTAQNGVEAGLRRGDKIGVVGAKLYRPAAWTTDKKRCEQAGMPKAERN